MPGVTRVLVNIILLYQLTKAFLFAIVIGICLCDYAGPLHKINEEANSDYEVSVVVQRSSINCSRSFWLSRTNKNSRICASQFKVEDITEDETCELVNGVELSIGEGDDAINAYLCTAVKNNNGTGILLLSDVFGFEDSATRDFAYLVACNGYK